MGIADIITPNRVSMGQSDAVAYCQSVAQDIYGDRYGKGIEAWLDDGLGSATTEKELAATTKRTVNRFITLFKKDC